MSKPLSKTKIKSLNKLMSKDVPEMDIIFILQDVEDPYNVGSIFRTADACGASVILTGKTPHPTKSPEVSKTSMGMERKVDWESYDDVESVITNLKQAGYEIVGVELTENAIPYDDFDYKQKTALVLGNEAIGIFKKNIELLDSVVFIPMLGKGPSLNVNIAAAIVGYQVISSAKRSW